MAADDPHLVDARKNLRRLQRIEAARSGLESFPAGQFGEDYTLRCLHELFETTLDGQENYVRRGIYKYERSKEADRLARAERLIARVEPGPDEDANYFAFLAYQAASLEMALQELTKATEEPREWDRILVGTAHSADINAGAKRLADRHYVRIVVLSGLIEFMYQAAKAIVAAQNPAPSADGKAIYSTRPLADDVKAYVARNPEPADRLYATLEAYYFYGYPRAVANEVIAQSHGLVLSALTGLAERFILGHEYGHALSVEDVTHPTLNPKWIDELHADSRGMILTVFSAFAFDCFPPELSLMAVVFALGCLDVRRRAYDVLRTGSERIDEGTETHPPFHLRKAAILEGFFRYFRPHYVGHRCTGLEFLADASGTGRDDEALVARFEGALQGADTIFLLWDAMKQRLVADYNASRPLHKRFRPSEGGA